MGEFKGGDSVRFARIEPFAKPAAARLLVGDDGEHGCLDRRFQIFHAPHAPREQFDQKRADQADNRTKGSAHHKHRSEEHTSELQSLMSNSYAVFCLKKKKKTTT